MSKLNIAVWGLGRHAFKNVLPAIKNCGEANLVGVYSRDETARSRASREYGCESFPDESSMLGDPRVTVVYLATPIGLHFEQGQRVLGSGRHLICEKSLTDSHAKSARLVAEARQRRLLLCEAFMYRFHPRTQSIFELVRHQEFGELVAVTCNFFLPRLEHPGYRYSANLGGGAFLDAGCYPISFFLGLGTETPAVSQARFHLTPGVEVDTSGMALLRWGARGQACLGWGYEAAYRNEATIIGEKQSLYVGQVFAKGGLGCSEIVLSDSHGKEERRSYEAADGFVKMLAYVKQALLSEKMKETLWTEAERQAQLMEQVREAAVRLG
jgi:dTDP-3,4-didehydro-2,6-dideoxy-alpha-D-glucose 3-reductase